MIIHRVTFYAAQNALLVKGLTGQYLSLGAGVKRVNDRVEPYIYGKNITR